MKRIIIGAVVALTALGGVASADRGRGRDRDIRYSRGGVSVNHSRGHYQHRPHYRHQRDRHYRDRYVHQPGVRYVRRPIYVQRPVVQYRYYNYQQRPSLIAENYNTMPGYYWVAGRWDWSGYEWVWTPGHYEPDANYSGEYSEPSNTYYDPNTGRYYVQPNGYDSNY